MRRGQRRWATFGKAALLFGITWVGYIVLSRTGTHNYIPPTIPVSVDLSRPLYKKPSPDEVASGEWGHAVKLGLADGSSEKHLEDESIEQYALNIYVSDRISLHRHIADRRMHECRTKHFDYRGLPTTSVVIAFYNEAWSTLLRTVHSVLESSPAILLKELILVDDYSDRPYLKSQLEDYLSKLDRVRLIRAKRREGLVRARLLGAIHATGRVLTFLDCHCECAPGWLEPLLERIMQNESTVVCPVIDTIDWMTFEYYMQTGEPAIGGFDWRLTFQWHSVPEHERQRRSSRADTLRSPTMAGGLFAVSKRYFEHIGTYDAGMEVWGGENLELSFRVWQCGGSLEILPCSHVGHVFPKKAPYARPRFLQNTVRAAEVWMDEYKQHFYNRNPPARKERVGDLSSRKTLRERLSCHTFSWYLQHIYPDLHVPQDRSGWHGAIHNKGLSTECLDYNAPVHEATGAHLSLFPCHGQGGNQFFEVTLQGEVRFNSVTELCAEAVAGRSWVGMQRCPRDGDLTPNSIIWIFKPDGTIAHPATSNCLTAFRTPTGAADVEMQPCKEQDHNQMWNFQ